MTTIDKVEHSALIYKCLEECGKNKTVMFSDFVVAASDEILKTRSTDSIRLLKSSWKKWVSIVAKQMNITVNYNYDNWHIIEKRLQPEKLPTITSTRSSDKTVSSSSSSNNTNNSSRSSKSTLGIPLSDDDKIEILGLYDRLENLKMWRLSSDRCVEKVMRGFCEKSNYLHPANSLVLDLEDDHWPEWFTKQELQEINAATERQKKHLPQEMKSYLDALSESDNVFLRDSWETLSDSWGGQRAALGSGILLSENYSKGTPAVRDLATNEIPFGYSEQLGIFLGNSKNSKKAKY